MFFFFQAEDGIRDYKVTGVQTCALPIYPLRRMQHHLSHRFGVRLLVGTEYGPLTPPPARERHVLHRVALPLRRPLSAEGDRKSTRLNSSHLVISYAVFCLKKKKTTLTGV